MGKRKLNYSLVLGPSFNISSTQPGEPPALDDASILTIPSPLTTIPIPLTIEFDIERHNLTNAGHFVIKIINLGENNRNFIRKDYAQTFIYKKCVLKAGYGSVLSGICLGNINRAFSFRQGTNYVTQIEGFDGGFDYLNNTYEKSWGSGTPLVTIANDIIGGLDFVKKGFIGPDFLSRPNLEKGSPYSGPALKILDELTEGSAFVDNETVHILADSECLIGPLTTINSRNGLLGTPVWQNTFLTLDMIFEPRVVVGQQILLDSLSEVENPALRGNKSVNGLWKVVGLKHRGIISETESGDAITSLTLDNYGILNPVGAA